MSVKMSAWGHSIFKISAIDRLRIRTDGDGIRTLILLRDCPLRCRYCINPFSWNEGKGYREYAAQELYDKVCIDRPYFMATGGGITFGGGEPLLQSEQIMEFYSLCRNEFNLYAETSLHVPRENVEITAKCVDQFYVDNGLMYRTTDLDDITQKALNFIVNPHEPIELKTDNLFELIINKTYELGNSKK